MSRLPDGSAAAAATPSAASSESAAPPDPHPIIAGYRVGDELGAGPLGKVYRAVREKDGLKVVFRGFSRPADADARKWAEAREQFRRLLDAHRKLSDGHPHVQQIVDFGDENGLFWIASEFFEGRTLHDILEKDGAQSLTWAIEVMRQVGDAVDHVAAKGLDHTGLTPFTILLVNPPPGASPDLVNVKVINFGLAHASPKFGSRFAAPEQQDGNFDGDRRSDVYAAGALLYELLSGRPVFDGMDLRDVARKAKTSTPTPLTHLPVYVQNVIGAMLHKEPSHRYPSIGAALDDLEAQRDPETRYSTGDAGPTVLPAGGVLPVVPPTAPTTLQPKLGIEGGDAYRGSAHHDAPWEKKGSGGSAATASPNAERIALQEFSLADQDLVIAQWRLAKAREAERERRRARWGRGGVLTKAGIAVGAVAALTLHAVWLVGGYQYASVAGASGGTAKATYGNAGTAQSLSQGKNFPLITGDSGNGRAILTGGAANRLMLDLRGARLHLAEGTVLAVKQNGYRGGPVRRFDLRQGRVTAWVDPNHRKDAVFEIDSGTVRAVAKGTRFTVAALDGGARVLIATEEGTVRVASGDDARATVSAGSQIVVRAADGSIGAPQTLSDGTKAALAKARKAMGGVPGGPGSLPTTLAVGEEGALMPVAEGVSAVVHLPRTISDRRAVLVALGSMQALATALQSTEEAPASLHLDSLSELGLKDAERTKLLAAFADSRLVSYRRLSGSEGYVVRARARDSAGTLLEARGGTARVVGNDDIE